MRNKTITEEIKNINGITFIWVTDGQGWNTAKHNLKEIFDVLKHLYCIKDLGNGILETNITNVLKNFIIFMINMNLMKDF